MDDSVYHNFKLSGDQKKKIQSAMQSGSSITLLFKHHQLTMNGNDRLYVGKRNKNRIEKSIVQAKGVRIQLSPPMLKKNLSGGFLSSLLTAVAPIAIDSIGNAYAEMGKTDAGRRRIEARLERLRGNGTDCRCQGKGVVDSLSTANVGAMKGVSKQYKKGLQLSQKPAIRKLAESTDLNTKKGQTEFLKDLKSIGAVSKKDMNGSGVLDDLWSGFKFGFTNPIGAIDLLVKEADRSISGKGMGIEQSGTGIQFL
jgi:hypothetical protein